MMRSRRPCLSATVWLLLFGGIVAPAALRAQDATAGAPAGTRVRITLADSLRQMPFGPRTTRLVGVLSRTSGDTIFVLPPGALMPTAVPRSAVRVIERSRGTSRLRSAIQHGVIAGITWGTLAQGGQLSGDGQARNALLWVGAGLGAGAALGAIRPYEHWQRVRH